MKAIVYRAPGHFDVVQRPDPTPGRDEVLVHPLAVGLCFTDKHWYDGTYGRVGGMIGGHEFCGEIVAVGIGVEDMELGDIVSIDPHMYCGNCNMCRAGLSMRCETMGTRVLGVHPECDGGLADLCVVPAYSCFRLPANMTVEAGASVDPACIATRAVRYSGVRIGDNVVVFGAEDYGLFVVNWLRSCGVNKIVCVDPLPVRRAAALAIGAHRVVDPRSGGVVDKVLSEVPTGADVVFVSCEDYIPESAMYLSQAFQVARIQGSLVPMRFYSPAPFANVVPHEAWLREVRMLSFGLFFGQEPAQGGRPRGDWQVALDALSDGRLTAPLTGFQRVQFDDLRNSSDLDELFATIPYDQTKVIVTL